MLAMRGKSLFEHKVGAAQQHHQDEDSKMTFKVKLQTQEKDLVQLRRRNTELLSQVHALDDAKMRAEKAARDAVSRVACYSDCLALPWLPFWI